MLIFTSDGKSIVNLDKMSVIRLIDGKGIVCFEPGEDGISYRLGNYDNKNKRVFQLIINMYANGEKVFFMPEK